MIHLSPAGNSALAESLIDSCSAEKEEKKETDATVFVHIYLIYIETR